MPEGTNKFKDIAFIVSKDLFDEQEKYINSNKYPEGELKSNFITLVRYKGVFTGELSRWSFGNQIALNRVQG